MGIIGYELITESTPFHEDNIHETYSQILGHCDDNGELEKLTYPDGIEISKDFRNLIDGLIIRQSKRFTYKQIIKHPFFRSIDWTNLRNQLPPIIPTISGDEDTSNFEDIEKKGRRSTYTKTIDTSTFSKGGNDFSGHNLPFIGYSFVHPDSTSSAFDKTNNDDLKITTKKTSDKNSSAIKNLKLDLLTAQRKSAQTESLEKMLLEANNELTNMKHDLKEKTGLLAAGKTEIKTLKSSLKISDEMRIKSDSEIADILKSTYQKWEKSKKSSEKNYEKLISEKKIEISCLTENLRTRENELHSKLNEVVHLQERVENYNELLKTTKTQNIVDKAEFEKNKKELITSYESKLIELKSKLQKEKEIQLKLLNDIRNLRSELNDSINLNKNLCESKLSSEKTVEDIKQRMIRQIEENSQLHESQLISAKQIEELENRLHDLEKDKSDAAASRRSSAEYASAQGSLENISILSSVVEHQLRNDLMTAKENEIAQRHRADRLEEAVNRLEQLIATIQNPIAIDHVLEKKNEKLEDQLVTVREQAIVERQASRTAHLSLYKLEKQIDDFNLEKKLTANRFEKIDKECSQLRSEKEDIERKFLDQSIQIERKKQQIDDLLTQIIDLKMNVKQEHKMWEKAEHDRMRDKSEIIEHVSRANRLEENLQERNRTVGSLVKEKDSLILENNRLNVERSKLEQQLCTVTDKSSEIEAELTILNRNYIMLKHACTLMEDQLNELSAMYENEVKQNEKHCEKHDDLWSKIRARDIDITNLRQELNTVKLQKTEIDNHYEQTEMELSNLKSQLSNEVKQKNDLETQVLNKATDLFNAQESVEVMLDETKGLQRINEKNHRELNILKEENSKILTDLFQIKEVVNNLSCENVAYLQQIDEKKEELEALKKSLSEQKNYYEQRDIKSEATKAQYEKLISFLQEQVTYFLFTIFTY